MSGPPVRDAGRFAEWVVGMQDGMRSGAGSDVPCDGCVACCTSGQTIVVDADEAAALPPGAVVDGALARHGDRCALLDAEDRCTVYAVRPRRCRTYDCRIFPATGIVPEADKPAIAARALEWRFRHESTEDRDRQAAVRLAVVAIRTNEVGRPTSATQLAAAAVLAHDELL
jgi:Fe-S-cluster containining protein